MRAVVSLPAWTSRSATKTWAPACAKVSAMDAPMPEPAPVTRAILFFRLNMDMTKNCRQLVQQFLEACHDLIDANRRHGHRCEPQRAGPEASAKQGRVGAAVVKVERGQGE